VSPSHKPAAILQTPVFTATVALIDLHSEGRADVWNLEPALHQKVQPVCADLRPGDRTAGLTTHVNAKEPQATDAAVQTKRPSKVREFAEGRFRELLEAAPDAIIEVDRQGHIVLLNAVTEKLFGYSREELLGRNVDSLIPDAASGRHAAHRAGYWSNPQTRPMGHGLTLQARRKTAANSRLKSA
jgi:PAS domain S-box-containing protein